MLICRSFFRRKNIKIYMLLIFFVYLIFNVLICFKEYALNRYDKYYEGSYFFIDTKQDLSLEFSNNKYFYLDRREENQYYIKCYHWFYMIDAYSELYNIIDKYDLEIEEVINDVDNSLIIKIMTMYDFIMKVLIVVYCMILLIMLWNIRLDFIHTNCLLRLLGFSNIKIYFYNIVNILLLNMVPLLINLLIYFCISLFMV